MKRILAITALMIAAALPLTLAQATQSQSGQATAAEQKGGSAEQEVLKVNKEYSEAYVRGDLAALNRILSDDFITTSPTGEVSDKARMAERFKSGNLKLEFGRDDDVQARVYGDMAVVTGLWTSKGQENGKAFSDTQRYTLTLVKRNDRWQAVAEQSSVVGAKPQGQQQQLIEKKP